MLGMNFSTRKNSLSTVNPKPANGVIFRYQSAGRTWVLSGLVSQYVVEGNEMFMLVTPVREYDEITGRWYPTLFTWVNRKLSTDAIVEVK